MRKLHFVALTVFATCGLTIGFVGCGSDEEIPTEGQTGDGGSEGSVVDEAGDALDNTIDGSRDPAADCKPQGQGCAASTECCTANCVNKQCAAPINGHCKLPDIACTSNKECCTLSCIGGKCSNKQCVADNLACGTNGDCCSGQCVPNGKGGGTCKPLNTTCKTSGNPCTAGDQCCSKFCNNGLCSDGVSFCAQIGDVCAAATDCCSGTCTKAAGAALGVCGDLASAPGTPDCLTKGSICGTATSGVPDCGGTCCSRICAPSGSAGGNYICQPPSGCAPTGELCRVDGDCCGATGSPQPLDGPVHCSKTDPNQPFGRCDNGTKCREPGSICKPSDQSCSAENNCCEPNGSTGSSFCNSDPDNCCKRDALGIPRCILNVVDCTKPLPVNATCATSADCCGKPCVNNKCLPSCVNLDGTCTTSADCCTGLPCVIPTGSSKGLCGGSYLPDGGVGPSDSGTPPKDGGTTDGGTDGSVVQPVCALYGQSCTIAANCCDGVPCNGGTCHYVIK